ncbi:hypothetical protein NBRC106471_2505 [Acetobacter pasteurianus subsp. pasteurianus LMG 1262 = NBRC 106471]|nr:hypothetical protein NBRC106471_2505 [Acetobacter pasteurianus subsp. pasteurianus LMG 1262 = NBRC 106471]
MPGDGAAEPSSERNRAWKGEGQDGGGVIDLPAAADHNEHRQRPYPVRDPDDGGRGTSTSAHRAVFRRYDAAPFVPCPRMVTGVCEINSVATCNHRPRRTEERDDMSS